MQAPTNNIFLSPDPLNHELAFMLYGSQGVLAEKLTEWAVYVHGRLHDKIAKLIKSGELQTLAGIHFESANRQGMAIQNSKVLIDFQFHYDEGSFLHHKGTFARMNYDRWANVLKSHPNIFDKETYIVQEVWSYNVFSKIQAKGKRLDKAE